MPSRKRNPSEPDFPHGEPKGYNLGCRKTYPCPATPTCTKAKIKQQRESRARTHGPARAAEEQDWALTGHVQKRLRQTLAAAGLDALLLRPGVTRAIIGQVERRRKAVVDPKLAEPLDHAWSYLVHGFDTLAPDFVHGKPASYNRLYCRCLPCRNATNRANVRRKQGVVTAHTIINLPGMNEHARALIDVAGVEPAARAAGVSYTSMQRVANGGDARARIAHAIMRTTIAEAARESRQVPTERAHQRVRSMWALGYPLKWIARQDDALTYWTLERLQPGKWTHVSVDEAVARIAARVGDTPAGPAMGVSEHYASQARTNARKSGYYPPIHYDEHGRLDYRSIPDHPWARLDARADTWLQIARLLVTTDMSQEQIGAAAGASDKKVGRAARALGLSYEHVGNESMLDHAACGHRFGPILDALDAYEGGERGPVTTALDLGLLDAEKILKSHPEVELWDEAAAATDLGVAA